jgi:hypothetical protein
MSSPYLQTSASRVRPYIVIERALGGDFALSQTAFRYVAEALAKAEKVVEAYVVLIERGTKNVIGFRTVREVEGALNGAAPIDGMRGPYWWLNAEFRNAREQVMAADLSAPF